MYAKIGTLALAVTLASTVARADVAGINRDDMLASMEAGCYAQQVSDPANRTLGVTADQMHAYCACLANAIYPDTTLTELLYYKATGQYTASYRENMTKASVYCAGKVIGR